MSRKRERERLQLTPEQKEFEAIMSRAMADRTMGYYDRAAEEMLTLPYRDQRKPWALSLWRELYGVVLNQFEESSYRENKWQGELMARLYQLWPKLGLEKAILKHNFPEQYAGEETVSGAEAAHVTYYYCGFGGKWGVLSLGRASLKFWDLETGEVIYAEETGIPAQASAIGRSGTHTLLAFAYSPAEAECLLGTDYYDGKAPSIAWSTRRQETYRRISCKRAGTYEKSHYANVRYYKVKGTVVSIDRGRENLEIDRETFEKNPVRGEVLPQRDFWRYHSPRYQEWIRETSSPEEAEEIFRENKLEEEREEKFVRIKTYQTITLAHDEIEGYLPAGTTSFVVHDDEYSKEPKAADLMHNDCVRVTLAVEDDESWIEEILTTGHGLRSMNAFPATTPITEVHMSSNAWFGIRNGNGEAFGIWEMDTAECLRKFEGHSDHVTCLSPNFDLKLIVSGSRDKTLRLWNQDTAECLRVFRGHDEVISKVCLSSDGSKILSADRRGVIKLWDTATGECLRTLEAHSENVSGLQLTSDARFAASGSWDKTVKLWNLEDGSCLQTFEHDDWVTSVDMTSDGQYLVSTCYAGTKVWELVWQLDPEKPFIGPG